MEIDGQMTIFDYLKPVDDSDINKLPELNEIARILNEKYGFRLNKRFDNFFKKDKYECKLNTSEGKADFEIWEGCFNFGEHERFVSVDIEWRLGGIGAPCINMREIFGVIERNVL